MNYVKLLLLIVILSAVNVSALDSLGTFKLGEEIRISQPCSDATYINISSISYPNSSISVSNIEMTYSGNGEFYYDFNLTGDEGRYDIRGISDGCEETFATTFYITLSGEVDNAQIIISDIVLLLAVILIMVLVSNKHKNTDFEGKNEMILDSNKNMGQTMAMGIVNHLFKNSFIWMYFLGWIFVLILRDIIYRFNSVEVYSYFVLVANVYSLGLFLVLVYMIGYTISYMKDAVGILSDKNWGVGG